MESIKEIYKIGHGPSSSHTMGPKKAAERFLAKNKNANRFEVILYGSLAATGKGHLTDFAIEDTFRKKNLKINWEPKTFLFCGSFFLRQFFLQLWVELLDY